MSRDVVRADAHLFAPQPAYHWKPGLSRGDNGVREFKGENPPDGAQIYYTLREPADHIELKIVDVTGETIRVLEANAEPGLHRITWDLRRDAVTRGRRQRMGELVPPGTYQVSLTVGRTTFVEALEVDRDPVFEQFEPWRRGESAASEVEMDPAAESEGDE